MRKRGRLDAAVALLIAGVCLAAGNAHAANWWETIKFKGDLRYRHEMLDTDDSDARHRHRIRARLGVSGEVSEFTKVGFQLASGSSDPVSTNQTLDDAFSTKSIGIDLAYFETKHPRLPGVTLTAGKFHNPFFKPGSSELLWDSDMNPEGATLDWTRDFENISVTLIGAGLWIDERSSGDDSWMGAGEGVLRFHLPEKKGSIAVGGGYYNYVNIMGYEPFYDEDSFGNTTAEFVNGDDTTMGYATEFELIEGFVEFNHQLGEYPLTIMGDFVSNTAADSLNTGWLIGFALGKAKDPGSWEVRYNYRRIEADAVFGLFADSDFRGGGSDARGHELGGALQLAKNTTFGVTYFINEIGLEMDSPSDFNRLQVDLQLKF
ncbi:putative porin [bacterium]|nr:putative porin [bacterium]